jgi:hypothetical protein
MFGLGMEASDAIRRIERMLAAIIEDSVFLCA